MQSPLRRITNTSEEGTSINPSLSGDGRFVGFESTEDIAGAGGFKSFRAIRANVSVDPPTFLQLGATRAPAPPISQDGSRIAFASKDNPVGTNADANSEIFLYDGAKLIQLTNTSPGDVANRVTNGNFLPSISDDGRYVAFTSNRNLAGQNADGNLEIFIFDTVALSVTQLTNSSGTVGFSDAKISGNGAFVAYIRDAGTTSSIRRDLLLQSRTNAAPLRVVATDVLSIAMTHGRAISDDGTRVVWTAETATNTTQVFLFDGRSNITRQITSLGSRATDVPLHPTISGDGSRIAFATRRSFLGNSDGSVDLYAYDIPSASFGRVTSGPSTATAEVVSSLNDDGSVIAFNFPRVLSGVLNSDFGNNSEIYVTGTPSRPASGTLTVVNGASFGNEPSTTEAIAPDSIAVARGSVLSNTTEGPIQFANGTFPLTVGGTRVTVNGRPAQIIFVSPTQVNFLVPPETELGTAEVIVTNSENFPSRGNVTTLRAAPGVFTFSGDGLGDGVVLDANTLLPGPFDPTNSNLRLIIFSTGVRNGTDVSVTAGGRALTIESIIASATMPGLDELHVLVPADLRGAGKVDLVVRAGGRDSNPAAVNFTGDAKRDIVINEFLADPPDGAAGDANKDGVRSTGDDEFVELVNTTTHDIDISGYQILTRSTGADTIRHTFASGTILPACTAIVIFGGGNLNPNDPAFGGAQILKASSGSLTLINSAGVITLRDQAATIVNFVSYGGSTGVDGDSNQSVTRSPDTTGSFTLHQSAAGAGGPLFSPGTRINGTPFNPCTPISRVEVSPSSATVEAGTQQQFTARAFDAGGNEVSGVIFSWQSSNTAAATIDQNGRATALALGSTQIRAAGRGVQSPAATLTVTPATPILTSVTISPASATTRVGETQQFTAQAKDQFGQDISGVTISFSTNNSAVATVDVISATSPTGSATATVTGRASGTAQITATAANASVTISSTPAILTVEPGAGQLLISEFRTRGPNGASDEFIEIYNPTLSTITIGGLKIRASNSAGTTSDRITIAAGTTLLSGRHYLVTNSTANTGYSGPVAGNQTYATGIADDGGIAITGSNGTSIIDAVGMNSGSAFKEGTTLAPLANNVNQSYERKPGGAFGNGTDTNNNASDFFLNANSSNPQNLDSSGLDLNTADLAVTKTGSPDPVTTGSGLTYSITVSNNGPGTAQSVLVTDNLPASVTFVSCSATAGGICGGTGNNRTISFSSLASGASATITLVVTVNGAAGTTVANTASATSATADPVPGNNSADASTVVQAPPTILSINDVAANEGNSGTTIFTFTVSSSTPAPAGGITFDIGTQDNTATTANNDYAARSLTTQTIPAGQQTYAFDVTVNGDMLVEANETFFVNLTNVSGANNPDGQGQGTIQNDDAANLVISQVYAGGGNSGAQFTNDFVEIFNRGATTVDFAATPYSIQYAGATANFGSNKVDLTSGMIAPGKYFLVQLSSGGAVGAPLPTPDTSGSINMAATAGKVALVAGATALNAASCPLGAQVSDFVGYGTTAECFEGSDSAPAPSATTADFRKTDGCTDTNDNAADFLTAAPAPRNSSSPANDCNAPSATTLTINNVAANEGNSGTTIFTFAVTLSAPAPAGGVSFNIATQDNTATVADADYVARTLTAQTIAAGNMAYAFDVTVNGDSNVEPNETFFVNVTNVSGATVADGQGLGTIQNDDSADDLVISQVYAGGGNSGALFTNDFVEIFNRGATTVDFAVTPYSIQYAGATANFGSNKVELTSGTIGPGKYFLVQLSSGGATGAPLPTPDATGSLNMAATAGKVSLVIGTGLLPVSTCPGEVEDAPFNPNNATIIDFVGYGSSAVCFEGPAGPAPAPSATSADFRLAAGCTDTDDNEADFLVAAPAPRNSSSPTNNCNGPTLTALNGAADEGDSGTSLFNFVVTLSEPAPAGGVTFDIATQDNSATVADGDYVARTLTLQTIPAGSTTFYFEVTVNGDLKFEINETFFINVTNISVPGITARQGVGTIQNDDPSNLVISQVYGGGSNSGAPFTNDFVEIFNRGNLPVNFTNTPFSIQYAGATANFGSNKVDLTSGIVGPGQYFLVQLAGGAIGAPLPTPDASGNIVMAGTAGKVALVVGTSSLPVSSCPRADDSTSVNPNHPNIADFVGYGTVAICYEGPGPAPAPSGTTADFRKAGGCVDTNDNSANFFVHAPGPRNTASPLNSCSPGTPPGLTINDVTVTEGNAGTRTATFTVSLSAPPTSSDVTFDIATQNNTATTANSDYVSKTLTNQIIPAGQQTYTFDVTVNGDTAVEPDETFFVNVTNVAGATVTDGQGTGTIQHDDVPSLSINDVSLTEGNAGTKLFSFNVSLSAPAPGTVTFDLATQDNTATIANNDYMARSLTSQTIPTGSQNYTFDVTVNGDVNIEPNETFLVNVTNVSGATVADPQGMGTILSDDSPMLSVDDVSASETNSGATTFTFTVTSSLPAPAGGITFDIATADGTAQDDNPATEDNDYVAGSATAQTITAGNTTKTFQVTVNGDTLVEPNETFLVNISNVSGAMVADSQGQGTIQNDDTANLVISQVYGGGGNAGAHFTHDFVEIFNPGSTTIDFSVTPYSIQYAGATGNFGSNKTDLTSGTIAPGKYFLVQLASGGAIGSPLPPADAIGATIMAATAGKVALVAGTIALPVSTCPGDDGTAPFNPNNLTIADLVGYGSSAICYEGPTGPAPAPSATASDFRKAGGCTDTNDNTADFFVHAPIPRNSSSPANNCVAGVPPNLTIDDVTVTEGNAGTTTATFTVSLSAPTSADVTFDIATQNNTATTANSDYVSKTQTNQLIPAGQQTFTFAVTVNGDTAVENDETFFVNVTNVSGATLLDGQGVGTIQNDDQPSLSINDVSLNEGNAGPTTFSFTVLLSAAAPTGGVTFDIATQDNTATVADNDYVTRTVLAHTIPAGSSSYTFDVTVNGDLAIETNETFLVNVTGVSGATVTDGVGQGTILNDDSPTLSINDVTQTETDSGTTIFTFTVTSSLPAPMGGITFDISTSDGTAQDDNPASEDNDYVARSLTGQTITSGNSTYMFNVTVNGDTLVEPDQTFAVNVTSVTGANVTDGIGQGTIQNDDSPNLVITQIYPGGNNAGATYRNDFIEIFNRGTTTIDFSVTPYSVQYAGATAAFGAANTKTDLTSGTIAPGRYFLIQEAGGTTNGAVLPTPDAIGTIAMSATAGKVALVLGTTAVAATTCPGDDVPAPTNPIGNNIVDFVGYGTGANCFEGAAVAPFSTSTAGGLDPDARSVIRASSCTDTNNNLTDFSNPTTAPVARNTATAAVICP